MKTEVAIASKLKIAIIALMAGLAVTTGVVFGLVQPMVTIEDAGYAIRTADNVANKLLRPDGKILKLVDIPADSMIYVNSFGYYADDGKTAIDKEFPLYMNDGSAIRFLNDKNWMITEEAQLLQTFEGLYLTDGHTYNIHREEVDPEEFILTSLENGLYIIAQAGQFQNLLTTEPIGMNAILRLSENGISWYEFKDGYLLYHENRNVYDAVITIGSHHYNYHDLLKALDLLREVQEDPSNPKTPEKIREAEEIIRGGELPWDDDGDGEDKRKEEEDTPSKPTEEQEEKDPSGEDQPDSKDPGTNPEDVPGKDPAEDTPGGGESGKSDDHDGDDPSDEPGKDPAEDTPGGEEGGKSDDHDGDDPSDEPGEDPGEATPGGEEGEHGSKEKEGQDQPQGGSETEEQGSSKEAEGTSGENEGSGEEGTGSGTGTETEPGKDPEKEASGDGEPGSEEGSETEKKDEEHSSEEEKERKPLDQFVEPKVSLSQLDEWCYAILGKLSVSDPSGALIKGVKATVYTAIEGNGRSYTNDEGFVCYPASTEKGAGYTGTTAMLRTTFAGPGEVAVATLQPDTKYYVQLQYRVEKTTKEKVTDETGKETELLTRERYNVFGDLIEVRTAKTTACDLPDLLTSWKVKFAELPNAAEIYGFRLKNASDYDPQAAIFTIENFKKNVTSYVNRLEFTFEDPTTGDVVVSRVSSKNIADAIAGKDVGFVVPSALSLRPNRTYLCSVKAYDRFGSEMSLQVGSESGSAVSSDRYKETIYTKKEKPTVFYEIQKNEAGDFVLDIQLKDPNRAMMSFEQDGSQYLQLLISDENGTYPDLIGSLDGESFIIPLGGDLYLPVKEPDAYGTVHYWLRLTNLAYAQNYLFETIGSYDCQPDALKDTTDPNMRIGRTQDAVLLSRTLHTAVLEHDNINFKVSIPTRLDETLGREISTLTAFSTDIAFEMDEGTSLSVLDMTDEFEISFTANGSTVGEPIRVTREMVNALTSEQKTEDGYVLRETTLSEPGIYLTYTETGYDRRAEVNPANIWRSLFITQGPSNDPEPVMQTLAPILKLEIRLPKGTTEVAGETIGYLPSYTTNYVDVKSYINQRSGDRIIPFKLTTSLSTNSFTTLRQPAKLLYDDYYIGSGKISFTNARIYDPDNAVRNNGQVTFTTSKGESVLFDKVMTAVADKNEAGVDITVPNVKKGSEYNLKFTSMLYSEEVSAENLSEKVIFAQTVTGTGSLSAQMTLDNIEMSVEGLESTSRYTWGEPGLDYDELYGDFRIPTALTPEYVRKAMAQSAEDYEGVGKRDAETHQKNQWLQSQNSPDLIWTEMLTIPSVEVDGVQKKATFIRFDWSVATDDVKYVYFYDADQNRIVTPNEKTTSGNMRILAAVPENAVYCRIRVPNYVEHAETGETALEVYGLPLSFYVTEQSDLWKPENFETDRVLNTDGTESTQEGNHLLRLPVIPGEIYMTDAEAAISMYSPTMVYMGTTAKVVYNSPIEIPANCGYMVINTELDTDEFHLYKVAYSTERNGAKKYTATLRVSLTDTFHYLTESKCVSAVVYSDQVIRKPNYTRNDALSISEITFTDDDMVAEDEFSFDFQVAPLQASSSYRIDLVADVNGEPTVLTSLEFNTEANYYLIHNNLELNYITLVPFGNYLVVEDFDHTMNNNAKFYGTIDFQGHLITRKTNGYLIRYNYGTISNLAYDFPERAEDPTPVVDTNYQNMEGLYLKVEGDIVFSNTDTSTLGIKFNRGLLEDFAVELGGDVVFGTTNVDTTAPARGSVLVYYNYSTIRNGYIYSVGGHGPVFLPIMRPTEATEKLNQSAVVVARQSAGEISNVFLKTDVWFADSVQSFQATTSADAFGAIFLAELSGGTVQNVYFSGEEYLTYQKTTYDTNGDPVITYVKSRQDTVDYEHFFAGITARGNIGNVYHMYRNTEYTYEKDSQNRSVIQIYFGGLYDKEWQASVLSDHFEIDSNIDKGYYPRLRLIEEMEKYQPYLPLPVTDITAVPELLTDRWENETDHTHTGGLIRLNFYNPVGYANRIRSLVIPGLGVFTEQGTVLMDSEENVRTVDRIVEQKEENGVWVVVLDASVDESEGDEYLSKYTVSSFTCGDAESLVTCNYKTRGFEFWKEIDHICDLDARNKTGGAWYDINEHKNWNYLLVSDLDFSTVDEYYAQISGSDSSHTGAFTGKLNGLQRDANGNEFKHTISNITLGGVSGTNMPYVFSELSGGAQIEHLIVDRMRITASSAPNRMVAGFIGSHEGDYDGNNRPLINDVHVTGSSVRGVGDIGLIIGSASGLSITNCSVSDHTYDESVGSVGGEITDYATTDASTYGGIVGRGENTLIRNSYVRNLNMNVKLCKNIRGAGGIAGYLTSADSLIENCYTTGKIVVTGENIGGIVGYVPEESYVSIQRCFSNTIIDVSGTHAGGVAGRLSYEVGRSVAFGSVFSTDGTFTHRITGTLPTTGELNRIFAYADQIITGKTVQDPDGAFRLLSKEDIIMPSTWKDLIGLGEFYDLSCVQGVNRVYNSITKTYYLFPKLYMTDGETYVWGQINEENPNLFCDGDLALPGVSGKQVLKVDQALYTPANVSDQEFKLTFMIYHEGFTFEEFKQMFNEGNVTVSVPGLGPTKQHGTFRGEGTFYGGTTDEYITVTMEDRTSTEEGAVSLFTITTNTVYSYFEFYRLTIFYRDTMRAKVELAEDVQFVDAQNHPVELWIEIDSWEKWCYYIIGRDATNNYALVTDTDATFEPHGKTEEKVRITGKIDMSAMADVADKPYFSDFCGLKFDILEGDTRDCGFYGNMMGDESHRSFVFNANDLGTPWIEYVKTELRYLTFEDIDANFTNPAQTVDNSMSGLILKAQKVTGCTFRDIDILASHLNQKYLAIISRVMSSIEDCDVENITMDSSDTNTYTTATSVYAAALVGQLYDGFVNIRAENIKVTMPRADYVAGLIGQLTNGNSLTEDITDNRAGYLRDFTVIARRPAGVIAVGRNNSTKNGLKYFGFFTLDGFYVEGTGHTYASGLIDTLSTGYFGYMTAKNGKVVNNYGNAGGIVAYRHSNVGMYYCNVINCEVYGYAATGGLNGTNFNSGISYSNVIDSTVISYHDAAGGIAGSIGYGSSQYDSARNTYVRGYGNTGGLFGTGMSCYVYYSYVAEDVVVESETGNVGGVFGSVAGSSTATTRYFYDNISGATVISDGAGAAGGIIGTIRIDSSYYHYNTRPVRNIFAGTITAKNWAGGIVGRWDNCATDKTTQVHTYDYPLSSYFTNNVFAGTIICPGDRVDALYNLRARGPEDTLPVLTTGFTSTWGTTTSDPSYGSVWNQAIINGVPVREDSSCSTIKAFFEAKDFRKQSTYTTLLGFSTSTWAFTYPGALTEFYPFINNAAIKPYETMDTAGNMVGIPLPPIGTNPAATTVYASGVDTINIETSLPEVYVRFTTLAGAVISSPHFEGMVDTSDGVATLPYDYQHNIVVGSGIEDGVIQNAVTYTPEDLRNTVMTSGDDWFFIDESGNAGGEAGGKVVTSTRDVLNELPDGLVALDYIEGTGTQWIETDYRTAANTTNFYIRYMLTEPPATPIGLFVCGATYRYIGIGTTGELYLHGKSFSGAQYKPSVGKVIFEYLKGGTSNINGTNYSTAASTTYRSTPLTLFTSISSDPEVYDRTYAKMRMYGFGVNEGTELVRYFVPAGKPDGAGGYSEVGLYEVFTKKLYTSAGTDEFLAGPTAEEAAQPVYLAPGYQKLPLIQSNGKQWLDTGIIPTKNTRLKMEANVKDAANQDIFGVGGANTSTYVWGLYNGGSKVYDNYGDDKAVTISGNKVSGLVTIDKNRNELIIDGAKTASYTHAAGNTVSATRTLYLFARHYGTTSAYRPTTMSLYYCQIWEDDVLIRDFVPCLEESSGTKGLYDTVNGTFYKSIGTEPFFNTETDSKLQFSVQEAQTRIPSLTALHLWQGKALSTDGTVYRFTGSQNTLSVDEEGSVFCSVVPRSADRPIYEQTYDMAEIPLGNEDESQRLENKLTPLDSTGRYVRLSYVQATGTQYIDTGLKPYGDHFKYSVTAKMTDASTKQQRLVGTWNNSTTFQTDLYINGSGYWSTAVNKSTGEWLASTVKATTTDKLTFTVDCRTGQRTIMDENGTVLYDVTKKYTNNVVAGSNIILMADASNAGVTSCTNFAKCYFYGATFYVYNDATGAFDVVRDFVPAFDRETETIGMYDLAAQDGDQHFYPSTSATGYPDQNGLTEPLRLGDDLKQLVAANTPVKVETFKNFTRLTGEVGGNPVEITLDYRLITKEMDRQGDKKYVQYLASPLDGGVYDSVSIQVKEDFATGEVTKYYSELWENGSLSTNWTLLSVPRNGVREVSDNFAANPNNTYAVIRYDNGNVIVVDYSVPQIIYQQNKSFLSYAGGMLMSMFSPVRTSKSAALRSSSGIRSLSFAPMLTQMVGASMEETENGTLTGETVDMIGASGVFVPGEGVYSTDGTLLLTEDAFRFEPATGVWTEDHLVLSESLLGSCVSEDALLEIAENILDQNADSMVLQCLIPAETEETGTVEIPADGEEKMSEKRAVLLVSPQIRREQETLLTSLRNKGLAEKLTSKILTTEIQEDGTAVLSGTVAKKTLEEFTAGYSGIQTAAYDPMLGEVAEIDLGTVYDGVASTASRSNTYAETLEDIDLHEKNLETLKIREQHAEQLISDTSSTGVNLMIIIAVGIIAVFGILGAVLLFQKKKTEE